MAVPGRPLPEWLREKLIKLLREGVPGVAIAERLGVSTSLVCRWKSDMKKEGKL